MCIGKNRSVFGKIFGDRDISFRLDTLILIHRYFVDGLAATAEQNVLCWVKADRKTMKRNMLDCKLTIPDQMGYEMGDGESMLGNSVTFTSVAGKILKSHEVCNH